MASLAAADEGEEGRAELSEFLPFGGNFRSLDLEKMCERWAALPDLPLEDATEEETAKVEVLRAAVMKAKGLSEPPSDWTKHHYLRGQMLCYLRARDGDLKLATERALECIEYLSNVYKGAVQYESYPQSKRDLWEANFPQGQFGKDKRGASVLYFKRAMYYWDTLFQEGVDRGVFLQGRSWVLDCEGVSYSKIMGSRWIAPKQKANFPSGEHPMPEGVKYIFVRNAPWIVQKGYQKKIFLFQKDEEDKYMERLLAEIDSDQIPACFGGTCKVPWPFGDGGEIVDEGEYETMHVSKLEVAKTTVAPKTTCLVEVKVVSRDINLKIEVAGDGAGGG
eukprot:g147.t1